MDELGHILREARETKGLTLTEVQEQIRINSKFLQALENGEYAALPTPVHVRGFLRNYARFLGLDPQPLLDRYQHNQNYQAAPATTERNRNSPTTEVPAALRQDQPFFDPVNVEVETGQRRDPESILRLVIIGALIVALALVANRFIPLLLGNGDGSRVITESITEFLQDVRDSDTEPAATDTETIDTVEADTDGTVLNPSGVITSTSRNNFDEAIPSPVPTRPQLPATMELIDLKLDIRERTFMEVTIDGDVVFSGWAREGDGPFEWEAEEEAKVLTGNAIGVFVTINDTPLGPLGERGESKEEVWRTTQ